METDTISDSEFAREVEALRAQRRISVNRPVIDPDLPDLASAHSSGSTSHDILNSQLASKERVVLRDDGPHTAALSISTSGEAQPSSGDLSKSRSSRQHFTARRRGTDQPAGVTSPTEPKPASDSPDKPLSSDPAHLFWVPASMHPEISPADFRKFLSDHAARAVRDARLSASAPHSPTSPTTSTLGAEAPDISISDRVAALRHQTDTSAAASTSSDLISRSTSLTRRGSTLRRQYQPENDLGDDELRLPSVASRSPLTLEELQQLEQIAEETTSSHDAARVRSVLRRNLSLDVGHLASESSNSGTELDEADAPIIVPLPGQILRRAARTKVRKASLSGDGRAGSRRRAGQGSMDATSLDGSRRMDFAEVAMAVLERTPSTASEPRTEVSSSDETETQLAPDDADRPSHALSDDQADEILDAYSRHSFISDSETQRSSVTSLPDSERDSTSYGAGSKASSPPTTPTPASVARGYFDVERSDSSSYSSQVAHQQLQLERQQPVYHSPSQPGQLVVQPTREAFANARVVAIETSTSPEPSDQTPDPNYTPEEVPWPQMDNVDQSNRITPVAVQRVPSTPPFEKSPSSQGQPAQYTPIVPAKSPAASAIPPQFTQQVSPAERNQHTPPGVAAPLGKVKDKEKKGSFGLSWFGLGKDEDERSTKKKEKDSSESSNFLSNLFSKKKNEDGQTMNSAGGQVQRMQLGGPHLTAGSLLDRQAQGMLTMGPNRYPIHIERAVYRLSHIKLANPRRPLYEQVLISNLMFWYLSIINKNQQAQQAQRVQQQQQQQQQPPALPQKQQPNLPQQSQGQGPQQGQMQMQGQQSSAQQVDHYGHGASSPASSQQQHGMMQGSAGSGELVAGPSGAGLQPNGIVSGMELNHMGDSGPSHEPMSGAQQQQQPTGRAPKGKRGHLTKANRAPPGTRTAEMAIPAAGYGMQHRQISDDMALQRDVQQFQKQQAAAHLQQQQQHYHHQKQMSASASGSSESYGPGSRSGGNGADFAVGQVIDPRLAGGYGNGSNGPASSYDRRAPQPPSASRSDASSSPSIRMNDVVGRTATEGWDRSQLDLDVYGGVVADHSSSTREQAAADGQAGRLGSAFQASNSGWSGPTRVGDTDQSWLGSLASSSSPQQTATSPERTLHANASPLTVPLVLEQKRSRSPGGAERRSDPTSNVPASRRDRSSEPVDSSRADASVNGGPAHGYHSTSHDSLPRNNNNSGGGRTRTEVTPPVQQSSHSTVRRWQTATVPSSSQSQRPTSPPTTSPYGAGGMQRSTSLEEVVVGRSSLGSGGDEYRGKQQQPQSTSPSLIRNGLSSGAGQENGSDAGRVRKVSQQGSTVGGVLSSSSPGGIKTLSLTGSAASLAMLEAAKSSRERRR
ncbi:hypothetical protein V8E36_002872 [Tilletia maclaganii]